MTNSLKDQTLQVAQEKFELFIINHFPEALKDDETEGEKQSYIIFKLTE